MGFGKKIFKSKHYTGHRLFGLGASRRLVKNIRKKIGLTSENKWARKVKRFLKGKPLSAGYSMPTSALDVGTYQYSGRSLSQLTGGV